MPEGQQMLFGEIIQTELFEPFISALEALQKKSSDDPDSLGEIELAEAVRYDEKTCSFSRVYENVPTREGTSHTIEISIRWQEIRDLTQRMIELANKD